MTLSLVLVARYAGSSPLEEEEPFHSNHGVRAGKTGQLRQRSSSGRRSNPKPDQSWHRRLKSHPDLDS